MSDAEGRKRGSQLVGHDREGASSTEAGRGELTWNSSWSVRKQPMQLSRSPAIQLSRNGSLRHQGGDMRADEHRP